MTMSFFVCFLELQLRKLITFFFKPFKMSIMKNIVHMPSETCVHTFINFFESDASFTPAEL